MTDLRYCRLGYVALNVTDMARSIAFYESLLGLQHAGEAASGEQLFRCSARHHDIVLHQATEPGLRRVGWEMQDAENLAKVRDLYRTLDVGIHEVSADECGLLGIHGGFRVSEPNTGATFEYFHSFDEADTAYTPTVAKIERLGHVVLNVQNHAATERFFLEQLNFRASDRIDGAVTFLRCFPNPLHHSLGLSNGKANRLHHVNFMVTDVDDIGKALWRMKKNDVPIVFGPGRHPPSDSMFLYFLDPDGMTVEYSFGMEEFPEVDAREPRRMPPGLQSVDYWGAVPSPQMASVGAIERLEATS
ncbi:MAG TPA: VOC family protein [Rhizomicrobium sp.]|jgi:2,3-dihydroxy-p-cumate/2,3-dihydroxybenzoate 3,4-dioxygenase